MIFIITFGNYFDKTLIFLYYLILLNRILHGVPCFFHSCPVAQGSQATQAESAPSRGFSCVLAIVLGVSTAQGDADWGMKPHPSCGLDKRAGS